MKKIMLIPFILLSLIFISCSVTKETTKKEEKTLSTVVKEFNNDVNLEIEKNVGWVNLMPGTPPKFHVSGKISLLKGDNYDVNKTELKFIKIFQSGKELYYIIPKVIEEFNGDRKKLTYSTINGLSINEELKIKEPVVFEFIFKEGKDELKYRENNIIIEEVQ